MNHRRSLKIVLGASLMLAAGFAAPGCSDDGNQPGRESISAPRKGGGVETTTGENVKPAAPTGGKALAK